MLVSSGILKEEEEVTLGEVIVFLFLNLGEEEDVIASFRASDIVAKSHVDSKAHAF